MIPRDPQAHAISNCTHARGRSREDRGQVRLRAKQLDRHLDRAREIRPEVAGPTRGFAVTAHHASFGPTLTTRTSSPLEETLVKLSRERQRVQGVIPAPFAARTIEARKHTLDSVADPPVQSPTCSADRGRAPRTRRSAPARSIGSPPRTTASRSVSRHPGLTLSRRSRRRGRGPSDSGWTTQSVCSARPTPWAPSRGVGRRRRSPSALPVRSPRRRMGRRHVLPALHLRAPKLCDPQSNEWAERRIGRNSSSREAQRGCFLRATLGVSSETPGHWFPVSCDDTSAGPRYALSGQCVRPDWRTPPRRQP